MPPQQQQGGLKRDLNVFIALAQALAYMLEAWSQIPSTCGSNYFRGQALIGWFLSFIIAAFSQSEQFMMFVLATGAWMIIHKVATFDRQRKGRRCHSMFIGISWLSFMGGNRLAYRLWNPVAAFITGKVMIDKGIEWGVFFMVVSILMFISGWYSAAAEKAQITAIHDSRAESEWLSSYMDR